MKQNMKKKALFPAVAMTLASVIALSGVTYAWFTTGTTGKVTGLDVNVQTAKGIQISLDAADWKSQITADDIITGIGKATGTYNGSKNQYPYDDPDKNDDEKTILPVSSAGIVDANGMMEMFYGQYNSDGTLSSAKETEKEGTNGNFVAFDLFFKTGSDTKLSLEFGDTKTNVSTSAAYGASDAATQNATRVAFIDLGSATTGKEAIKLKTSQGVTIWEPNDKTRVKSVELEDVEDGVKLPYKGFDHDAAKLTKADLAELPDVTTVSADAGDITWDLEAGVNKIRIYIWLEGQDVDCINDISFGDFVTNLYFSVPDDTTEAGE